MIIYGKQVCLYALKHHSEKIKTVYVAKKNILPQELFHKFHDNIKFLEEKWAQSMAKGGNHQGILVEIEAFEEADFYVRNYLLPFTFLFLNRLRFTEKDVRNLKIKK